MIYRARPGARYTERSALRASPIRRAKRAVLPVPVTVPELQAQLAEIVVHETGCRWTTSRRLPIRRDETLPAAEQRSCTCTAIAHRQHLFELITRTGAAAPAQRTS